MDEKKRMIHLDRTEYMVVSGIVVLVAALMFTLGVFVGFGLKPKEEGGELHAEVKHSTLKTMGHDSDSHGRSPASTNKEAHAALVPGERLIKNFLKSKQDALDELAQDEDTDLAEPISVSDAGAFLKDGEGGAFKARKPASLPVSNANPEPVKSTVAPNPEKEKRVSSLFERSPASENSFKPLYGDYTVEIESFVSPDEAMAKVSGLRKSGFNDAYYAPYKKGGEEWYRVGIGSFRDKKYAEKVRVTALKRGLSTNPSVSKVER